MAAVVGENGDGFAVVAGENAAELAPAGVEGDAVPDGEPHHLAVGADVGDDAEALDDAAVKVAELGFGELVDVDGRRGHDGRIARGAGVMG